MKKYPEGSVHGRFQPMHNGHLRYILAAKEQCQFLWIGVTQYNIHSLRETPTDPHRQKQVHNPLTYFERVEMITKVLLDNGLAFGEFDVTPFLIETPSCLPDFLPAHVPVFTTVYDQWNRHKIEVLENIGYKVIVLWEEMIKAIDGIKIRELIILGDDTWKQLVPRATAIIIEKYCIRDRLIKLREKDELTTTD